MFNPMSITESRFDHLQALPSSDPSSSSVKLNSNELLINSVFFVTTPMYFLRKSTRLVVEERQRTLSWSCSLGHSLSHSNVVFKRLLERVTWRCMCRFALISVTNNLKRRPPQSKLELWINRVFIDQKGTGCLWDENRGCFGGLCVTAFTTLIANLLRYPFWWSCLREVPPYHENNFAISYFAT